jgi:hypothetical protein
MEFKQIVDAAIKWIQGILLTPDATVAEYRGLEAPWQRTLMEVTVPVVVVAYVLGFVVSLVTGGAMSFGASASAPFWFVVSMVWSLGFVFVAAFVFDLFAGNFGGERSFDRAFAMVSLALIPGVLGGLLAPLPWIGWLLSLAATIYGLVLLYRFVPIFLAVPDANRVTHFVVALVVCIAANLVAAAVIGGAAATSMIGTG